MNVAQLSRRDTAGAADWDAFVLGCPEATFFHRSAWQGIIADVFRHEPHFLYAERDGRIEGVLPLVHVKSLLFGNSLVSLPFAVYGGVAAANEVAAEALEQEAQRLAQRLNVGHLELRQLRSRHPDWPRQELYATFRKPILPEEDANMLSIPRKQRAMVRKGMRNGLTGAFDDGVDRFFALYADNVHRHGTPALPRRYFEVLRERFGADCTVLSVCLDGRALSSVLSFTFRDEILPYYAGDDESARELAANDFKYWELMRHACKHGLKVFDFGRSKVGTGPYAFKKNWGFEPQPLHYEYCLYKRHAVPQNHPANAKFRFLIKAWRRMPLALANRVGPLVVRGLG